MRSSRGPCIAISKCACRAASMRSATRSSPCERGMRCVIAMIGQSTPHARARPVQLKGRAPTLGRRAQAGRPPREWARRTRVRRGTAGGVLRAPNEARRSAPVGRGTRLSARGGRRHCGRLSQRNDLPVGGSTETQLPCPRCKPRAEALNLPRLCLGACNLAEVPRHEWAR